jgi:hypothetical protein
MPDQKSIGGWGHEESPGWRSLPGQPAPTAQSGRRIVPVEEPLPDDQVGPFLLESLQKPPQGFDDVSCVDSHTLWRVIVGVDHTLIVKECQHHLFGTGGDNLSLNRAWHALLSHGIDRHMSQGCA